MEYTKIISLLAVTVSALMAFTGLASATTFTSPAGATLGVGSKLKIESSGSVTFDGTINISCQNSSSEGEMTNSGGQNDTVKYNVVKWTFSNCGNHTVTVTALGTLEFHSIGSNTGTATSSDLTITILTHSLFLGTRHCLYKTNNSDIGTLTGSNHSGHTTATLHVDSIPVEQEPTDGLCGNDAEMTATYVVISPHHLFVDTT